MSGLTVTGYPYPDYLDQPNGPLQLQQLAEAVEQNTILKFSDAIARDAVISSPQPGMLAYLADTSALTKFSSGVWRTYTPRNPPPLAWTNMVMGTNWSAYGAGWSTPAYTKDVLGFVHLRGLAHNTGTDTAGRSTTCTTLPAGFRPAGINVFITHQSGQGETAVFARVEIGTDGTIKWPSQYAPTITGGYIFFENVMFEAA